MRYLSGATSGTVVAGGNGAGVGSTQLFGPIGIALDLTTNSILIANNDAHNVLQWTIGASTWTLIAGSSSGIQGNTSNLLFYPTNIKLDSMSNRYIADRSNHRVVYIAYGRTNYTTIAGIIGVPGSNPNQLNIPSSVAIDSQFNIYVADDGNNRIQKFIHY